MHGPWRRPGSLAFDLPSLNQAQTDLAKLIAGPLWTTLIYHRWLVVSGRRDLLDTELRLPPLSTHRITLAEDLTTLHADQW